MNKEEKMAQQQPQGTIQTRTALLVFCKEMTSPMVLYFDNAQKIYEDLKAVINSTQVQMVEFEPLGPIKKAAILSDRIIGVALQEERYLTQQ